MIQILLSTEQLYYIKLIFLELSLKVSISSIKSCFSALSKLEEINIKSYNHSSSIRFLERLFISFIFEKPLSVLLAVSPKYHN